MNKGAFISFEGPDGAGKSTQMKRVAELLRARGFDVVMTREPGGSALAEKIRALVINEPMDGLTEVLLLNAGRRDHVEQVIKPALSRGTVVLSDRFFDSAYAYQGWGRGEMTHLHEVQNLAVGDFEPDYTLFFDISLEVCTSRFVSRNNPAGLDKFEKETNAFFHRVFSGFEEVLRDNPHRMHRIDASVSPDAVTLAIEKWIDTVFMPTVGLPNKGVLPLVRKYYKLRRNLLRQYRRIFKKGAHAARK